MAYYGINLVKTVMTAMRKNFDARWATELFVYLTTLTSRTVALLESSESDRENILRLAANAVSGLGCICAAVRYQLYRHES